MERVRTSPPSLSLRRGVGTLLLLKEKEMEDEVLDFKTGWSIRFFLFDNYQLSEVDNFIPFLNICNINPGAEA
jgi:hypothetical protein